MKQLSEKQNLHILGVLDNICKQSTVYFKAYEKSFFIVSCKDVETIEKYVKEVCDYVDEVKKQLIDLKEMKGII